MKKGWEEKTLGELAFVKSGGTPSRAKKGYWEGDIAWYSSGELNDFYTKDPIRHINELAVNNSTAKLFPKGSLLIGMYDTAALKMSIIDREATFNQAIAGVKPNDKIDLTFVLHSINSIKTELLNLRRGVRQKNLNLGIIKKIPIPFPPLPEQKRIVAILDKAFAAIAKAKANAEQNLKSAEDLFESYLQGMFENKGEGWVEKSLSELCSIKHGFAFKSHFFSNKGKHVLLTPGNFYEAGGYRNRGEKQKYYIGEIPEGYILKKGDLLVAMTEQAAGLLGSPILVPDSNIFLHNQRLGLVLPKENAPWVNEFFFHFFNTRGVRKILHSTGTGIKVRHTSPTKIGDVIVTFPSSIEAQKTIVKKLDALSAETKKLEAIYQKKIEDLDELKKSILQKAFNGELTEKEMPKIEG